MSNKQRQLDPKQDIHSQPGWLDTILNYLEAHGGAGFKDREGHIVLLTRSAKQAGNWQATWFRSAGPYTDRLDTDPRRLLAAIAPQLRYWLSHEQIDLALNRLLCARPASAFEG